MAIMNKIMQATRAIVGILFIEPEYSIWSVRPGTGLWGGFRGSAPFGWSVLEIAFTAAELRLPWHRRDSEDCG
jgi:hypothetical protein